MVFAMNAVLHNVSCNLCPCSGYRHWVALHFCVPVFDATCGSEMNQSISERCEMYSSGESMTKNDKEKQDGLCRRIVLYCVLLVRYG